MHIKSTGRLGSRLQRRLFDCAMKRCPQSQMHPRKDHGQSVPAADGVGRPLGTRGNRRRWICQKGGGDVAPLWGPLLDFKGRKKRAASQARSSTRPYSRSPCKAQSRRAPFKGPLSNPVSKGPTRHVFKKRAPLFARRWAPSKTTRCASKTRGSCDPGMARPRPSQRALEEMSPGEDGPVKAVR